MILVMIALGSYAGAALVVGGVFAVWARGQGERRWLLEGAKIGLRWPWGALKLLPFELLPDWSDVLRRAWSVRLILLAGLLTGAEALLAFAWPGLFGLPPGALAALSALVAAGAFVARLLAQKST